MSITMNKGYILHNLLLANDNNKIDEYFQKEGINIKFRK